MKELKKFKKGDRVVAIGNYDGRDIDGLTGRILDSETNWFDDYAVEFDKDIYGHTCGDRGKDRHCWWVKPSHLRPATNETIVVYQKGNEVIALNKATGKKGIAKCCPSDTFDFATGAKLAFERLMDDGSVKEVMRHAEVGEYIRIIKSSGCPGDEYKVGDILKVVEPPKTLMKDYARIRAYYKTMLAKYVDDGEYVVLENYKPEEKPQLYNGKVICVDNNNNNCFTTGKIYQVVDGKITDNKHDKFPCAKPLSSFRDLEVYFGSDKKARDGVFNSKTPIKFIEVIE